MKFPNTEQAAREREAPTDFGSAGEIIHGDK